MPSIARWRVRQSVAQLLGDLTQYEATEDAPDLSTAVFKDTRRLARDELLVKGQDIVVVSATATENLYWRTRVDGLDRTNRTATVDPEFPAYIRGGDKMHGFMHRGTGWRIEEYDNFINEVITEMDRSFAEEVSTTLDTAFDRYSPYLAIPENWVGIWGIEYQYADDTWDETLEPFEIDQANRQVIIPYNDRARMNTRTIKLWGYRMYDEMTEDDDTTRCPLGYLKWMTAAQLLLSGEARQITEEVENKAMLYLQRGTEFMQQVTPRIRPNVRWLD